MIPACFATLLWSFCVIASRRSLEQLGEIPANFWRMIVAVLCLGLVSHLSGAQFENRVFIYLFLSGVLGFGIGDLGLYAALSRIGSRLTILMAQCAAVPVAFFIEWLTLGNLISWAEGLSILVILGGITVALLPRKQELHNPNRKRFAWGIVFGLVAALGQGAGGVLSRIAYEAKSATIVPKDAVEGILIGSSAGYQRLLGGLLVIGAAYCVSKALSRFRGESMPIRAGDSAVTKFNWIVIAALSGPVVGIAFFQWALVMTEAAIAQAIVAMTPIVIMPFTFWFEGERPSRRSIAGGLIAVSGVLLLLFGS